MSLHPLDPPSACDVQASGAIELYFYGELEGAEAREVEGHAAGCGYCREALEELRLIRDALASRPDVSAPASGEWSGFMARLDAAIADDVRARAALMSQTPRRASRSLAGYVAVAATLAAVTIGVFSAIRYRPMDPVEPKETAAVPAAAAQTSPGEAAQLERISDEHFRRSKLVVLGLATKDAQHTTPEDWTYERSLASDLLSDTRIYRMAAEDRGLTQVAGVMRDLELVLLETSLTSDTNASALAQIQQLIRRRDLVQKMNAVGTTGL